MMCVANNETDGVHESGCIRSKRKKLAAIIVEQKQQRHTYRHRQIITKEDKSFAKVIMNWANNQMRDREKKNIRKK